MVIYETINLINGMRYIGQDLNNNPEYLGSGLLLRRAIDKYGKENFTKTILEHCKSRDELSKREIFWINKHNAVKSDIYYNIASGGNGGDCITGLDPEKYKALSLKKSLNMMGSKNPMYGKTHSIESKTKMRHIGPENGMYGKTHTDKTKQLQKDKSIGRFTLEWFQKRYGDVDGESKFIERNANLSESRKAAANAMYKHIDKNDLITQLKQEGSTISSISEFFGVTSSCIYNKFRLYFNTHYPKEVRKIINAL